MDADFQKVWDRVTAGKRLTEEEQLLSFLAAEQKDAAEYTGLARHTGSAQARRLFLKMAAEEREHAKQLRSMVYLLGKGGLLPASAPVKTVKGERTLQALRRMFAEEEKRAEDYLTAAASAQNPRLQKLYAELAEAEQRHGSALMSLLKGLM